LYLYLKSLHDQQMANTRNRVANENNNNNNNNANPPPPPTLEQVLIMQAQILQTMQQTMANMQQAPQYQPAPQQQPRDKLGEFQQTKPLTFSHFVKPMDGDDWLKIVEKELQVVQCNNREKVLFTTQQLVGPAADWWDAYVEAHEKPETINWQEFKNIFRSHHVMLGVMKLKKEFEDLKQGSMTMREYVTRFTQLSHYAPDNVDIDEKKQDWFLNGLNDSLAYALEARVRNQVVSSLV
jgi:hypothetical protein